MKIVNSRATVMQTLLDKRSELSQNDFDTWFLSNKNQLIEEERDMIIKSANQNIVGDDELRETLFLPRLNRKATNKGEAYYELMFMFNVNPTTLTTTVTTTESTQQ
jgi:hypothetical protein